MDWKEPEWMAKIFLWSLIFKFHFFPLLPNFNWNEEFFGGKIIILLPSYFFAFWFIFILRFSLHIFGDTISIKIRNLCSMYGMLKRFWSAWFWNVLSYLINNGAFNENTAHDNAENMHKSVSVQLICAF